MRFGDRTAAASDPLVLWSGLPLPAGVSPAVLIQKDQNQ